MSINNKKTSSFLTVFKKLRSKNGRITLPEITKEVESVRSKRVKKKK